VIEERTRAKVRCPRISINTVINKDTYRVLEETVSLVKDLGVEGLNFVYGWNISARMGAHYEKVCEKLFGIRAASWKGFEKCDIDMDLRELADIVAKIRGRGEDGLRVTFLPDISPGAIPGFYAGTLASLAKRKCYSLWHRVDVRHNGDVILCSDFPDYVLGNVKEASLNAIWNNERARDFRRKVRGMGLLPICSRCCNLYTNTIPFLVE